MIMRRETRIARIPAEMQRYCEQTRLERKVKEKGERFNDRGYLIVVKQYDYDEDMLETNREGHFARMVGTLLFEFCHKCSTSLPQRSAADRRREAWTLH